jgi:hypothetical protein
MRFVLPVVTLGALALGPATAHAQFANVDACTLLVPSEASIAIEVPVTEGHYITETTKSACSWSDAGSADPDHRRVTLSIEPPSVFASMKSSPRLKTEAVSGIGDEAYYIYPSGAGPILAVRKGGVAFQIKILNGFKVKPPLAAKDVKDRELVLGKAAAGRA